jgi:hypothetical protein
MYIIEEVFVQQPAVTSDAPQEYGGLGDTYLLKRYGETTRCLDPFCYSDMPSRSWNC